MNYLGHLALSPTSNDWQLGSLLGDHIKGYLTDDTERTLGKEIVAGIRLHRRLDVWTDQNKHFVDSAMRLASQRYRFSKIFVDLFYDHYFSKNWAELHPEKLKDFSEAVYELIRANRHLLPVEARPRFDLMVEEDWLQKYADLDFLKITIERVEKRLSRTKDLSGIFQNFKTNYLAIERDFFAFFPKADSFAKQTVGELSSNTKK